MSDWDADSADEKAAAAAPPKPAYTPAATSSFRRNFDDEEEDDVKDDWDDDDDEDDDKKKQAAAASASSSAPGKKRLTVKQKIAEKEAEERRRAELGEDDEEEEDDDDEDPAARRKRDREAQIRADVENAANLLGTSRISADDALAKLRSANPVSKEDWEAYANNVFNELLKRQSSRPGYDKHFAPFVTKLVYAPLRDVEIRKGSTKLRELAEEKTKAEKEAKKNPGGKKTKPKSIGTSSAKNTMDLSAYGDEALDDGDDLDFM
ncbi:Translation initiation factor 3 subunit J component [Tilletia horrida]|uniref:Eukaryotic translation initiation factor 3 subunit J n=1 Tax=Tilletia horrida TaxID=155126 RepID=A0AAN6JJQ6_9BASI|nr:Translation initiation factor 3 subunit J component [Tilletia horrida]KAK0535419.1 Translation initiation factor 3 subunit J component [Tilletia horrida]KAK0538091.1 Translation initiation factor 3 subunit J component [Tilletia horrida]KAK0565521.1 Translation initiation factor 3 subunit J component [Tilletia horrida]